MKAAVSTQNCQHLHSYCLWWGRVGGPDRFRHRVVADSIDDAVRQSRLTVSKALGTNASLWKIEEPKVKTTRAIPTDATSRGEGPRRSSQQIAIMAFVLLWLGLFFLLQWKLRAASAGPKESDASYGIMGTESHSENIPTTSWDSFIRSTRNH
jgi:hypothetical protein